MLFGKIIVIKRSGSDGAQFPLTARHCLFGSAKDGVEKSSTRMVLADGTGFIKAICYDDAKLTILKADNNVMLRNYIKKSDNTLVINRPTIVYKTSSVSLTQDVTEAEEEDKIQKTTKNNETVDQKKVTLKDTTAEVEVTLWRNQASLSLPFATWQLVTDLRLSVFYGKRSFNSTYKTQVLEKQQPAETATVIIDGFHGDDEAHLTVICHTEDEPEKFNDYTVNRDILSATITAEEEDLENILLDLLPVKVHITIQNNDIKTITMV